MFNQILAFLASIPEILDMIKKAFSAHERAKKTKRIDASKELEQAKSDEERNKALKKILDNI